MVLKAQNLVKHYGNHEALRGLNLHVQAGEVFCLLGANGAGKTTTIQLFLGFIEPTSGSASIKGLQVRDHALETKRYLAYIPENVMLYPNLVSEHVVEQLHDAGYREIARFSGWLDWGNGDVVVLGR